MKQINVRVSDEMHRAIKTKAAKEGKTMTEVIVTGLQEWLEKENDDDGQTARQTRIDN